MNTRTKCDATWYGYHPPSDHHCPPLPHTGFDLSLLLIVASFIIIVGIVLKIIVGKIYSGEHQ